MTRHGFRVQVTSPEGEKFIRKAMDKAPGEGENVVERIPFKFEFDETLRPNFGRITLTNIKPKHRKQFKKGEKLTLEAGWLPEKENHQMKLDLDITNTNTYVRDGGSTYDTDIMVRDTPTSYHRYVLAKHWHRGIEAKEVLEDIVKNELCVPVKEWRCDSSKTYKRGKSFYLPAIQAIRQVSSDVQGKFFFYNKGAYLLPANESIPTSITTTGNDIVSGTFDKAGVNHKAIFQMLPRAKPAHDIHVSTDELKGNFSVYSGKHTSEDGRKLYSILRFK